MTQLDTVTAFQGSRRIATGPLAEVALAARLVADNAAAPILIFDDHSSMPIEVDFRGSPEELSVRLAGAPSASPPESRGRGRPKLGVVAREVTLLPRHWDWLGQQPGGASTTLRKLVEEARRTVSPAAELRRAQTALYRFMTAMAGDAAGYEEAIRALFAGDRTRFAALTGDWPADVRDHIGRLAPAAFGERPSALDGVIPPGRIEAARRAIEAAFPGAVVDSAEAIAGGASGALIFRIALRGADYLMRLETAGDTFRVPERQYACQKTAAEVGVAPRLIHADVEHGIVITDFIGARPQADAGGRDAWIGAIVDKVRVLHAAPLFPGLVGYLDGVDILIGRLGETGILPPQAMDALRATFGSLAVAYPRADADLVSSHNDLNPSNLLFDGQRAWIVDWESAFAADRYVDTAAIANFFAVDAADEDLILRRYFGAALDDYRRARFFLMQQINRLFYVAVMLAAAAAERPGVQLTAADLVTPRFVDVRGELGSLAAYEGKVRFGCVFLNEAIGHVASPRFAEAAALVAGA